jgi:retron-type reverse transcriptase
MENGIVMRTDEGSPQGGNLSPLLANIYLDKFDKEFEGRGVKVIRYADDIILLAKSIRAAERLLGTSTEYLEKKLKLKVNTEKSRAVSVYSIRNFGFSALQWEGTEVVVTSEFIQSRRRKPKTNCES